MTVRSNKGFSLVELMIVVAIIGILSAIAVPNFRRFQLKSMQTEAKNQLAALYGAEKAYTAEWSQYFADFRNIGYAPEGKMKYEVGFKNAGIVNATNYTGNGAVASAAATMFTTFGGLGTAATTATFCANTLDGGKNACAYVSATGAQVANVAAANIAAANVSLPNLFTAAAVGDIAGNGTAPNAAFDEWSINQDKTVQNAKSGL